MSTSPPWNPSRAVALEHLRAFLPHAGRLYAETRNHDLGPDDRSNVSTLSPYVRHRLILEPELVTAALERHGPVAAEKFVQEVCWRTYWKGWLELRPSVWTDYQRRLAQFWESSEPRPSLRDRVEAAEKGETEIECLNAWARELVETGYLHNHARMWFASLWIFTLGLPWAAGADFFLRHLLDGDPASNTLSWRWAAGLQTRGKTYRADPDNIARFTNGRFRPTEAFASACEPEDEPAPPPPRALRPPDFPRAEPSALLLTEEDLHPESLDGRPATIVAIAGVHATSGRSPRPVSEAVCRFVQGAVREALNRAGSEFAVDSVDLGEAGVPEIVAWAQSTGARQVITPYAPVGPTASRLKALAPALSEAGIRLVRVQRPWDATLWPHATAGFFAFKQKLPRLLAELGIHHAR